MEIVRPACLTTALAFAVMGCSYGAMTGDELIDWVVLEEAGRYQCVEIGPKTLFIEDTDNSRPRVGAYPGAFSSKELNEMTKGLAIAPDQIDWAEFDANNTTMFGEPDTIDGTGSCTMHVSQPAFVKNHAFIEFSAPSGAIGVYAFEKTRNRWHVAERVNNGWW